MAWHHMLILPHGVSAGKSETNKWFPLTLNALKNINACTARREVINGVTGGPNLLERSGLFCQTQHHHLSLFFSFFLLAHVKPQSLCCCLYLKKHPVFWRMRRANVRLCAGTIGLGKHAHVSETISSSSLLETIRP